MNAPRIKMYTTPWCGYCIAARRLLKRQGIPFEDVDVSSDRPRRNALIAETGWRTVPMIFIDGTLIGGYTELAALHSQGGLPAPAAP